MPKALILKMDFPKFYGKKRKKIEQGLTRSQRKGRTKKIKICCCQGPKSGRSKVKDPIATQRLPATNCQKKSGK
jgi:hypothetical protein